MMKAVASITVVASDVQELCKCVLLQAHLLLQLLLAMYKCCMYLNEVAGFVAAFCNHWNQLISSGMLLDVPGHRHNESFVMLDYFPGILKVPVLF
jgi:hypothetical protein